MYHLARLFLLLALPSFLLACGGGGGGGDNSGDTTQSQNTTYTIFSHDNLSPGNNLSLDITGRDSDGYTYTGTLSFADRGIVMFGGLSLNQVDSLISLTDNLGASVSVLVNHYTDPTTNEPVTNVNTSTGVTSTPTSISMLPATATPGDFGTSTSWSNDDGSTETGTWRLEASTDGFGKLIFSTTSRDSGGSVTSIEDDSIFIDAAGNVISIEIRLWYPSGFTVNLTGS